MTDKLKESISALIDGEASEIEVHRLLRQLNGESTLESSWMNYLQVRSVVQGEGRIPVARHQELFERISSAVQAEEVYNLKTARSVPLVRTFAKPIAGLAVAASLAVAVMVGYYVQTPRTVVQQMASDNHGAMASQVIATQPVSTDTVRAAEPQTQPPEFRQLDQEQQRELRAYLNMHDQMARMDPNAQMVIYENPTPNQ